MLLQPGPLGVGGQRAVADVVDAAREGVQRRHGLALVGRQQPDAVGEVAGLLPGDGLAVAVCGEYRCGRVRSSDSTVRLTPLFAVSRPTSRSRLSLVGLGGPGSTSYPAAAIAREGGPPSRHESGEQQPQPAVDATHQGGAFIQQVAGAFRLVRDQGAHRCARGRARRGPPRDVEALHVLGGQVDAVAAEVLGDVLEVLDDLQGGADRVGAADPLGGRGAGDGEDEPADGVGGQLAVGEQVVVGLVPPDQLVLAVGLDQAEEGLGGEARGGGRWAGGARSSGWRGRRRRCRRRGRRSASKASSMREPVVGVGRVEARGGRASAPPGARSPSPMSSTRRA